MKPDPLNRIRSFLLLVFLAVMLLADLGSSVLAQAPAAKQPSPEPLAKAETFDVAAKEYASRLLVDGKEVFRFDTFGGEEFWGKKLRLHDAIQGSQHGGMGKGISPKKALGLKVDMEAVPKQVAAGIKSGKVDLDDPANTLVLLKANAVVGLERIFRLW